jgi:cytochrome b561
MEPRAGMAASFPGGSRMTDRGTYARPQIVLHWTIVALIIVQMLSADGMSAYFEPAKEAGMAPGLPGPGLALAHAMSGATILVLVILRFALRLRYGALPPPRDLPRVLQIIARFTHYALYAVLLLLPFSGATTLLISPEAGDVHQALKNVLYALAAAHVLGALTHLVILRDGVFWRMIPIRRAE